MRRKKTPAGIQQSDHRRPNEKADEKGKKTVLMKRPAQTATRAAGVSRQRAQSEVEINAGKTN